MIVVTGAAGFIGSCMIKALSDAGYADIISEIKKSGLMWLPSLPTIKFINLYRNAWALIGNSSSGIHETPTFKIPAINIGNRQMGRERAENVIDVPNDRVEIEKALRKALFDEEFRNFVSTIKNPYGEGNSAEKIVNILRTVPLGIEIIQKKFYE